MPNLNYVRSVSPAFNALSHAASGQGVASGLQALAGLGNPGPLSGSTPAAQAMQQQATQYRPATQVYERGVFGNQFRDTTPQERSAYNAHHLGDRRNVGHGQGQVDPGLAAAARQKESDNAEGGGGK